LSDGAEPGEDSGDLLRFRRDAALFDAIDGALEDGVEIRADQDLRVLVDDNDLVEHRDDRCACIEVAFAGDCVRVLRQNPLDQPEVGLCAQEGVGLVVGLVVAAKQLIQRILRRHVVVPRLVVTDDVAARPVGAAVPAVGQDGDASGDFRRLKPVDLHAGPLLKWAAPAAAAPAIQITGVFRRDCGSAAVGNAPR
jgi:hypothetical protein